MSSPTETPGTAFIETTIARYFAATRNGDRDGWVACFAPDATSRDPVNGPPIVGHEALRRFYESITGLVATIGLEAQHTYVCGDRAAVKWIGRGTSKSGKPYVFEGIDTFEFDARGRIRLLEAYWDPAKLMAQLG